MRRNVQLGELTSRRLANFFRLLLLLLVAALVLVAFVAFGLELIRGNWRLVVSMVIGGTFLGVSGYLATRKLPVDLVAVLWGLGFGGSLWTEVVFQIVPPAQQLEKLQDHAFDFFGAGGLAAFTMYLSARRTWARLPAMAVIMAIIGSVTAFSFRGTREQVTGCLVGGMVVGLFLGGLFTLLGGPGGIQVDEEGHLVFTEETASDDKAAPDDR